MEDQFGGRTDDDLFYDDFEPVDSASVVKKTPKTPSFAPPSASQPVESTAALKSTPSSIPPSMSLASSRYADKPIATTTCSSSSSSSQNNAADAGPPATAPSHDLQKSARAPSQNNAANAEARLKSGANPRQKLTDDELAAKMAKMKLLAAEKTRKFEMAEKDEKQHAEAYARGMEEARKRRAEEAERHRRGDEERRKLDDERARNRERKLKAMSMKDGGWDEGKEAVADVPERAFRGANGGIRGARTAGLGGSRFARGADVPDVDRFLDERHRTRGRGRAGRDAVHPRGQGRGPPQPKIEETTPMLFTDEFPALPSAAEGRRNTGPAASTLPAVPPPLPSPPGGGKWDDEMEAQDAIKQGQA